MGPANSINAEQSRLQCKKLWVPTSRDQQKRFRDRFGFATQNAMSDNDTAKRCNVTSAWTSTSGVPQPKPRQPTLRFSHRLMTDGAGSRRKVSPADLKGTPNILHCTSQQIRYLIRQRVNHTSQQPICHGGMPTRVNIICDKFVRLHQDQT